MIGMLCTAFGFRLEQFTQFDVAQVNWDYAWWVIACGTCEDVQGVLTLLCSGAAKVVFHALRVEELSGQLEVEEEDGDIQEEEEEEEEKGEVESKRHRTLRSHSSYIVANVFTYPFLRRILQYWRFSVYTPRR